MKIAFLLGNFSNVGGIGRVTSILLNHFSSKEDFSFMAITYQKDIGNPQYDLPFNITKLYLFEDRVPMVKAMLLKGAVSKLKKIIKENNIDILVASGVLFYPLVKHAVKGTNCLFYAWEHTNPYSDNDYKFQGLGRISAKKANRSILISKEGYDFYVERLKINPKLLTLIYNPIDPTIITPPSYNSSSKKIVSVGRLSYQKNFQSAIRVASVVFKVANDWTWDIYGEGRDRPELESMIKKLGLENKVFLKGNVKNLYDLLPEYSFFVMTSRYEGFPMSLLEAGKSGLPLISYDIKTGPKEIITDGENGYLIKELDERKLADTILLLINSEQKRQNLSRNIIKSMSRFSIDEIIEQWESIFK